MNEKMKLELEDRTREAQNDPRSTHELIALALTAADEDAAWAAVTTLHYRGSKDVFEEARQLCESDCPQERTLGSNILGQLGIPTRIFRKESVSVLLKLLEVEKDEEVLRAVCIALGHIHDPTAIPVLTRFKTHTSAAVRYAVVFGLLDFEEDMATHTLIELTNDQNDLVRDWATFGLGSQIQTNTPQIREALFARLFDEDEVVRGEALVGLALRKDERIIEPLIKELARYPDGKSGRFGVEAAEEIADTRLLPILTSLKQSTGAATFDEAISCCSE